MAIEEPHEETREEAEERQEQFRDFPRDGWDCASRALSGGTVTGILYCLFGAGAGYFLGDAALGSYIGAGVGFGTGAPTILMLSLNKLRERNESEEFERAFGNRRKNAQGIDGRVH